MADSVPESTRQTLDRLYDDPDDRLASLFELTPGDTGIEATRVFKALSNEHRIRILEALREGELCACELEAVLNAPQSTVASHLRELKDVGLVRSTEVVEFRRTARHPDGVEPAVPADRVLGQEVVRPAVPPGGDVPRVLDRLATLGAVQ
jgi:ArsR family transcriptional regulator